MTDKILQVGNITQLTLERTAPRVFRVKQSPRTVTREELEERKRRHLLAILKTYHVLEPEIVREFIDSVK